MGTKHSLNVTPNARGGEVPVGLAAEGAGAGGDGKWHSSYCAAKNGGQNRLSNTSNLPPTGEGAAYYLPWSSCGRLEKFFAMLLAGWSTRCFPLGGTTDEMNGSDTVSKLASPHG